MVLAPSRLRCLPVPDAPEKNPGRVAGCGRDGPDGADTVNAAGSAAVLAAAGILPAPCSVERPHPGPRTTRQWQIHHTPLPSLGGPDGSVVLRVHRDRRNNQRTCSSGNRPAHRCPWSREPGSPAREGPPATGPSPGVAISLRPPGSLVAIRHNRLHQPSPSPKRARLPGRA